MRFFLTLLFFWNIAGFAQTLEIGKLYHLKEGMSADEIMRIVYHNKYSLFCKDITFKGEVIYVDSPTLMRKRKYIKHRVILGKDDFSYKELTAITYPTEVKGLAILVWSYILPYKDQQVWLWLPALKKVRKISASQDDDAFMGTDFTVEEVSTRRFEDETYRLIGEKKFAGYRSKYKNEMLFKGRDCFVIEARSKKAHWYYDKRTIWIDKKTGGHIYEEYFDKRGRLFKKIFRKWELIKVGDKLYPTQIALEVEDLRTHHRTVILMKDIKYDQGLEESLFTVKTLMRSRW